MTTHEAENKKVSCEAKQTRNLARKIDDNNSVRCWVWSRIKDRERANFTQLKGDLEDAET